MGISQPLFWKGQLTCATTPIATWPAEQARDTIIELHLPEDLPNPDDYSCLPECCDTPYVGDHYALTEAEADALPRTAPGISTPDEFQDYRVIAKNRNGILYASWFSR